MEKEEYYKTTKSFKKKSRKREARKRQNPTHKDVSVDRLYLFNSSVIKSRNWSSAAVK